MDFVIMTIIRLFVPLVILRWPLPGAFLAILADMSDWHVLTLTTAQDYAFYQSWDKILDLYYMSLEAWIVLSWNPIWLKKLIISLFAFRLLGVVLFELTGFRLFLLFFPNIFESIFIFYLIFLTLEKNGYNLPSLRTSLAVFFAIAIPSKVIIEYFLHVAPTYIVKPIWSWKDNLIQRLIHPDIFLIIFYLALFTVLLIVIYKRQSLFKAQDNIVQVDKNLS